MKIKKDIARSITRDALVSLLLYALPVVLMLGYFYFAGQRPWELAGPQSPELAGQRIGDLGKAKSALGFLGPVCRNLNTWGLPVIMVVGGVAEWPLGVFWRGCTPDAVV